MGIADKAENKGQEVGGKIKEGVGNATDNDRLRAEGSVDQAAAKTKQASENVKDAAKNLLD